MKTFNEFLKEKWTVDVKTAANKSTPVYENPSSSDITALFKSSIKSLRFIAVNKTKTVYVWDANSILHLPMIQRLKADNKIPSDVDYENPKTVFTSIAKIRSGKAVFDGDPSSDVFFTDAYDYANAGMTITKSELPKGFHSPDTFVDELKTMIKDYAFVDKYISNFTEDFAPAVILNRLTDSY